MILTINDRAAKEFATEELAETFGGTQALHLQVRREGKEITIPIE